MVVAVFAVVEVSKFVLWVVGVVSRGGRFGSQRRVAGILSGSPQFQFVDAGLAVVGGGLGSETDEADLFGREGLGVAPGINCRAKGGWTGRGFTSLVSSREWRLR